MQSGEYPPSGGQPEGDTPQSGYGAPIPPPTGEAQGYGTGASYGTAPSYGGANTSGQGANSLVPPEIAQMGFNWGAFLMNWIWGIGNKSYIAFVGFALAFIPCVGSIAAIAFNIWLGMNGNKLAWQNRQFSSVEEFKAVQAAWTKWGIILLVLGFVLGIVLGATGALTGLLHGSASYSTSR